MIRTCYLCGRELTRANAAREHVIPSALGGKLRSRSLLCRTCNSTTGHEVDADLARYLEPICNLVDVHRDRGQPRRVVVTRTDGERLVREADGWLRPETARTQVNPDGEGIRFSITAPDRRSARRALERLKKDYPKLDVNAALGQLDNRPTYIDEPLTFNVSVSGADSVRAVAKIAVGFYLHSGGDPAHVPDAIAFVRGEAPRFDENGGWHDGPDVISPALPGVVHVLAVVGDPSRRTLLSYVELFTAFRFAVVLSKCYAGPTMRAVYAYDIVARRPVRLEPHHIAVDDWSVTERPNVDVIRRGLEHLRRAGQERSEKVQLERLVQEAFKNCLRESPDASAEDLWPHLCRGMEPWIRARLRAQHVARRRERRGR